MSTQPDIAEILTGQICKSTSLDNPTITFGGDKGGRWVRQRASQTGGEGPVWVECFLFEYPDGRTSTCDHLGAGYQAIFERQEAVREGRS